MIGVFTQTKPLSSKKRWIDCAIVCRTRVTAPITLVRGAQVRDLAQELERVRLRLDRIGIRVLDPADDLDRARLHLERLTLRRRRDDRSRRLDRAARGQVEHLVGIVRERARRDDLHRMERRTVGDVHERDAGLRIAARAHPALQRDGVVFRRAARKNVRTSELGHRMPRIIGNVTVRHSIRMSVRIVRLGSPRHPAEGPRIGTVRRPPRGVAEIGIRAAELVRRLVSAALAEPGRP